MENMSIEDLLKENRILRNKFYLLLYRINELSKTETSDFIVGYVKGYLYDSAKDIDPVIEGIKRGVANSVSDSYKDF